MIKLNEIELDFEPRKKILAKLPEGYRNAEMTEFESAFLCGAIKKFQPKKIVELGVAEGGTTAVILQALEDLGQEYHMDSIDLATRLYHDKSKKTGFIVEYAKNNHIFSAPPNNTLYTGTVLPLQIDNIGKDIDFVILDTIHSLPGELLDFIAILPYLKEGAIVVLHDLRFHLRRLNYYLYNATATLFSNVVADKFLNYQQDSVDLIYNYPDIGAFQINDQTKKNIENVFLALTQKWIYFPTREYLRAYYGIYERYYSPDLCKIYEEALKMNFLTLREEFAIKEYKNGNLNRIDILGDEYFV